ncbi:hypothetical protein LTR97_011064 [Elasticomyces elasticus]|uniref:G-patch domain-containing protein n=1 Tax=Elasticomyces elasticus TaxID=574655 RepID=A0AAN7VX68_9PEZI|nr:hypothetical protein LTR97_011064 [Elasticomyces elasticus]
MDHRFTEDMYSDGAHQSSDNRGRDDREFSIKGRAGRVDGPRYDDRPPPAKRPYRGPSRYEEEDYYAEQPVVDLSYRGENDVSLDGRPMRLLLVRNLKESLSEDLFAKGLEKLYQDPTTVPTNGPVIGAPPGSLHRVLIIRDRLTDKSMTFGFAEYHSVAAATAALAKAGEMADKCTIASRVVEITFPHLSVFPRADFGGQERSERFTVTMSSTGMQHKYHDERYYATEMVVNAESLRSSPAKDGSAALDGKEKSKKRKAPGATTAAAPAFLQHWQNKAAELRTEEQKAAYEKENQRADKASRLPASGVNAIATPAVSDQQTFAVDTSKLKCCYLCAAQFQTSEGLQRHLKESSKHAQNLGNEDAEGKAHERLKKAGVSLDSTIKLLTPSTASSTAAEDQAYRDRAAERRRVETVTGVKDTSSLPSFSLKGNKTASPAPPDAASTPAYGKGLGLLQKAGWKEGQGLGRNDGEGITAPIEQSLYASGVGLGHESSKKGDAVEEAQRMTKGERGGFLEKTREVARQRYERMG